MGRRKCFDDSVREPSLALGNEGRKFSDNGMKRLTVHSRTDGLI